LTAGKVINMAGSKVIDWNTPSLKVSLNVGSDGVVRLQSTNPAGQVSPDQGERTCFFPESALPLTEIRLAGEGTDDTKSAKTLVCGSVSLRNKYQSHKESTNGAQHKLEITSIDEKSGLRVVATLISYDNTPTLRSFTTAHNDGGNDIILTQISSLTLGGLTGGTHKWSEEYVASTATNTWFREAQWHDYDLPTLGVDDIGVLELNQGHYGSHAAYSVSNHGGFSSGGMLPMGMLKRKDGKETWLWQIENNGSWRWEIGDFKDAIYLALGGPDSFSHDWRECLKAGQSFTTVPCALTHIYEGGIDTAFTALTKYRRHTRRPHQDNQSLGLIFNDYMNCLMGDPTEEKVKALVKPALHCGAEYFVIDAVSMRLSVARKAE
jgi:alpha-galactosidase